MFEFARAARDVGIYSVAGFPAVESLWDLYAEPPVFWLSLEKFCNGDCEFIVDLSDRSLKPADGENEIPKTLPEKTLVERVQNNCKMLLWDDAMQLISELRMKRYRNDFFSRFAWFSGYKPVYFLIPNQP